MQNSLNKQPKWVTYKPPIKLRYPLILLVALVVFHVIFSPKTSEEKERFRNKNERCNYPFMLHLHSDFQREETPDFYYKNGFNISCEKRTKTA